MHAAKDSADRRRSVWPSRSDRRAVGYKLVGSEMGPSYGERAFGHPGLGGSIGVADPDKRMSLGYVMNKQWGGARGTDPRASSVADAVYECID